ncbi:hypothetical protein LCGC14_1759150 [marine sediment metagenome]|uniref:Radical SAM core domain-containing protein n=1 Tax=marine sediment metagenome TaxID=412755 RepID=A0A0F9H1M5_9ZZZZ
MTTAQGEIIRVFPRKTKWSPNDDLAFFDGPPLFDVPNLPVMVSVTFTWDIERGKKLAHSWGNRRREVWIGGPAFDDPGEEFVPGRFIKQGVTITSRGCSKNCSFCYVRGREGKIRELPIRDGWVVQDNNLLACSQKHIIKVFKMLQRQDLAAAFPGGLDLDYLAPWHIDALKELQDNHKFAALWVAFDEPRGMKNLNKAKDLLADFSQKRKFAYVLIGYEGDTHSDAEGRCEKVYNAGFLPFAMLWDGNTDPAWKPIQRKWARPAIYRSKQA